MYLLEIIPNSPLHKNKQEEAKREEHDSIKEEQLSKGVKKLPIITP